ncbi:hypothetical protein HYPSUDRAFT_52256 [Hypholoma sublateritium FD-334 SS-4]|uniref:Uncharacterized protein n=1 Tax=Hypholoma sublateritium (strain FD-334 SS-4) TaxID=945553 RepID=A0A0D2P739_HYPSF|nr:hypothetical protein HYPSUDRAFT_52256 [Hypholoma sublateritium FD-334 SS-4]
MSLSNTPPDFDYELPGDVANPSSLKARHKMLQVGYSRQFNPRLLEYIFYTPWNHVLNALVYDIPHILVVPQHVIYRKREDKQAPGGSKISERTNPQQNADSRTPDFGLLHVEDTPIPGKTEAHFAPPWNEMSIQSLFVSLLCEIKRPPSRSTPSPAKFTGRLMQKLDTAKHELYCAAAILFANERLDHQPNSIILIAVSGEWYSWTELRRDHFPDPDVSKKNWFLNAWPTRDLDRKTGTWKMDEEGTLKFQKSVLIKGTKNSNIKKDKNDSLNEQEDNSEDEEDHSNKEEDDSDKEEDDSAEEEADSDREADSSIKEAANSDEDNSDEEEEDDSRNLKEDDPNDEEDKDLDEKNISDLDDDLLGVRGTISESDDSDEETSRSKPHITEYYHRILDDPDLAHIRDTVYQGISTKKGGAIKLARAEWTGAIRLGTHVSNQHLAAIHERLKDVVPKNTRHNKPKPKTSGPGTTRPKTVGRETRASRAR